MKIKITAILMITGLFVGSTWMAQADDVDVKKLWAKNCYACHGKDGTGKTKAGRKSKVKDLTDKEYQKSFTDELAIKNIKEGTEVDGKQVRKPLGDKLTAEEINALVAFVREMGK